LELKIKALELKSIGEVQAVGYRRAIVKIARKLGISGYVKNKDDGSVLILAQGEEEALQSFVRAAKINDLPINVEEIQIRERKPVSRYETFAIKSGSLVEELQEGLGAGEIQLKTLNDNFNDYRGEFRQFAGRTDENFKSLNDNFNDYRGEFKNYTGEFSQFASRTDENFKLLGDKYGEISAKLTQVLETLERESAETRRELTRAVDKLSNLVDQYIKSQQEKR
jgi:acylphosphatase